MRNDKDVALGLHAMFVMYMASMARLVILSHIEVGTQDVLLIMA